MALAATTVMNLPLDVYAFSVFLGPLEAELAVTRAELSFVFGFALVAFTAGMNLAPMLYRFQRQRRWLPAPRRLPVSASCSPPTPAVSGSLSSAMVCSSALARWCRLRPAASGREPDAGWAPGLVNGFIVSLYPAGAMIGAPLFGLALSHWGLRATLGGLATTLAVAGVVSSVACGGLRPDRGCTRDQAGRSGRAQGFDFPAPLGCLLSGRRRRPSRARSGRRHGRGLWRRRGTGAVHHDGGHRLHRGRALAAAGSPTVSRHPW